MLLASHSAFVGELQILGVASQRAADRSSNGRGAVPYVVNQLFLWEITNSTNLPVADNDLTKMCPSRHKAKQ